MRLARRFMWLRPSGGRSEKLLADNDKAQLRPYTSLNAQTREERAVIFRHLPWESQGGPVSRHDLVHYVEHAQQSVNRAALNGSN